MIVIEDHESVLGTIDIQGTVLTGSNRGMQRLADQAAARAGSAQEAYDKLAKLDNGYVRARPSVLGLANQLDLTGDGHGHHIPGTPMVYKHGWKPISGQMAGLGASADPPPDIDRLWQHLQGEAAAARDMEQESIARNVEMAADAMRRGNRDSFAMAALWMHNAADLAEGDGMDAQARRYRGYAHQLLSINKDVPQLGTPRSAAQDFAVKGAPVVAGLIGGGKSGFTGNVQIMDTYSSPAVLAEMEWDGSMGVREDIATHLKTALDMKNEPVADPEPFAVILHELVHAAIPEDQAYQQHRAAYQDQNTADIEEGFTELGAIHHAPEFFNAMGIGNRPTEVIAHPIEDTVNTGKQDDLVGMMDNLIAETRSRPRAAVIIPRLIKAEDALKHGDSANFTAYLDQARNRSDDREVVRAIDSILDNMSGLSHIKRETLSMSDYARRLQDPEKIVRGAPWGHYGWQTRTAYEWAMEVAHAEGKRGPKALQARIRELSDEVNRQGSAGKIRAMAEQVVRASGVTPDRLGQFMTPTAWDGLMDEIRARWGSGGIKAFERAIGRARAAMKKAGLATS